MGEERKAVDGWTIRASKVRTRLKSCPVGLFLYGETLCLKTEYGNNEGRIDAYIVESGEFFWGDSPQTIESQREQMVRRVHVVGSIDATDAMALAMRVKQAEAVFAAQSAEIARLREGAGLKTAQLAAFVEALQYVMSAHGEQLHDAFDQAERLLATLAAERALAPQPGAAAEEVG